jgi:hypothetical protein
MNKPNSWEKWDKETEVRWSKEDLEKSKSGSIVFIKDLDKWGNWHLYHYHWEKWLTTDYWKNWQEKINSFQTTDEVHFYTERLRAIMEFVQSHTKKDVRCLLEGEKSWDLINTPKLIEQELKRLENISEEDFKKEDKFADVEWKELSVQEMSNDPWFNKEIDNFFGIDGKIKNNSPKSQEDEAYYSDIELRNSDEYGRLTREELIKEIKWLKAELQKERNKQNAEIRQEVSQKLESQLHKAESILNNIETSGNSPKSSNVLPISIGAVGLVVLFGVLIAYKKPPKKNLYSVKKPKN